MQADWKFKVKRVVIVWGNGSETPIDYRNQKDLYQWYREIRKVGFVKPKELTVKVNLHG